ncbi:hypothetical protein ESA94_01240 [Lacibacter luteus]|uniref:Uncharacterized protein n=1 Tax=Lacibacter luteus TaxID=2508719 RepID=A0A4Q1CL54_9BACT|nr:hypothetical protein [Lacibacter luteus]RXK61670.1 hypothetical protein ESA94_01240 [Lacibacter luteus]
MKIISFALLICSCISATSALKLSDRSVKKIQSPKTVNNTVLGVFAGRTPCQEFLNEYNLGENAACAKRKMGVILYQDAVTLQPTVYETWGMGKWTGKGNWNIVKGTASDPNAIVFQLQLDANTFLFLLKGDENVLFILDKKKDFLVGNESHSYTLNRERNRIPWEQMIYLENKGSSE